MSHVQVSYLGETPTGGMLLSPTANIVSPPPGVQVQSSTGPIPSLESLSGVLALVHRVPILSPSLKVHVGVSTAHYILVFVNISVLFPKITLIPCIAEA